MRTAITPFPRTRIIPPADPVNNMSQLLADAAVQAEIIKAAATRLEALRTRYLAITAPATTSVDRLAAAGLTSWVDDVAAVVADPVAIMLCDLADRAG